MADDPLAKIAADARERPLLYATVAVAGLAGVAAAVALTSRTPPSVRRTAASALVNVARRSLENAGARASESAESAADRAREGAASAREAAAPDDERRRDGDDKASGSSPGIGESTAAIFLGTLFSKAFTGWMRVRAEERARTQGMALAGGVSAGSGGGRVTPALEQRLDEMSVVELRALASEREVEGRSSMNKDELIEALDGDA